MSAFVLIVEGNSQLKEEWQIMLRYTQGKQRQTLGIVQSVTASFQLKMNGFPISILINIVSHGWTSIPPLISHNPVNYNMHPLKRYELSYTHTLFLFLSLSLLLSLTHTPHIFQHMHT